MPPIKPTLVEAWDILDRADGLELRVEFKRGGDRKINFRDDDAQNVAETFLRVLNSDDRPLPEHVGSSKEDNHD